MIQRELQEDTEHVLLAYIYNIDILPLDQFASIIPTYTIIDIFDIILCIYVHFQHCFWNLSKA